MKSSLPCAVQYGSLCLLIMCLSQASATGADPGSRERAFVRALELFDNAKTPDDYRAAARELQTIVDDGFESGAVYYNLGNAFYRAGDYGRAIINYRKAKPYRPRDTYLEANLQQALAAAPGKLTPPAIPWWNHVLFWSEWLSFPAKVRITAVGIMLAAVCVLLANLLQRSVLYLLAAALLIGSGLIGLDMVLSDPGRSRRAVIVAETTARKGTGKDYEPAFDQPLRDGAEFTVLNQTADWTLGHFEGIGDGWVRNEFVAR